MNQNHIQNLLSLRRHYRPNESPSWHIQLYQPELNGGKISLEALKKLADTPHATALTISGLEQKTFDYLCQHFSHQFTAIHFWKCPRVTDLSALEEMQHLTHVAFYWNQRTTRLWNLAKTPLLKGLHLDDFIKLQELYDLAQGQGLEELHFGDANWSKMVVNTLAPLSGLKQLKVLSFNPHAIQDQRIQPIANLTQLSELYFPIKLFTTEQLAWLKAHLPNTVAASELAPYQQLRHPYNRKGKLLDVIVSGKGKPYLSSEADVIKLERYINEFNEMVQHFSADLLLEP